MEEFLEYITFFVSLLLLSALIGIYLVSARADEGIATGANSEMDSYAQIIASDELMRYKGTLCTGLDVLNVIDRLCRQDYKVVVKLYAKTGEINLMNFAGPNKQINGMPFTGNDYNDWINAIRSVCTYENSTVLRPTLDYSVSFEADEKTGVVDTIIFTAEEV